MARTPAIEFASYDDLLDAYEAQDGRAGFVFETAEHSGITRLWVLLPTGMMSRLPMGEPDGWNVVRNENGTVSVTPSIWNHGGPGEWHGYLTESVFVD